MWLHRISGTILALAGVAIVIYLGRALYGDSAQDLHTLLQIGIPGVLLICLAAGSAIVIGLGFALAPGTVIRHVSRATGMKSGSR